jgi:hypothetical protein
MFNITSTYIPSIISSNECTMTRAILHDVAHALAAVVRLDKAPVETTFFYGWDCTEDTLLTSEVGVVAGGVTGGLGWNAAKKIL